MLEIKDFKHFLCHALPKKMQTTDTSRSCMATKKSIHRPSGRRRRANVLLEAVRVVEDQLYYATLSTEISWPYKGFLRVILARNLLTAEGFLGNIKIKLAEHTRQIILKLSSISVAPRPINS